MLQRCPYDARALERVFIGTQMTSRPRTLRLSRLPVLGCRACRRVYR